MNNKTKDSRGIFEHYSEDPKSFEQEMKELTDDVENIYMPKFQSVISKIVIIVTKCICNDINLGIFIDNSLDIDNESDAYPRMALENQLQNMMVISNKQVAYFSSFDSIYKFSNELSKCVYGKPDNKARLQEDFNELEFICSQIQRDIM